MQQRQKRASGLGGTLDTAAPIMHPRNQPRPVGRALCGASHRSLAIEAKSGAVILLAAAECVRFESCASGLNFTWSCLGLGLPWKAKLEIILIVQETAAPSQIMIPRCDPSLVLSCLGVLEDQTQGKPGWRNIAAPEPRVTLKYNPPK